MSTCPIGSVSVVIPLHNKGGWIRETLRSVFNQTVRPQEVIVVENGSTDDGPRKVRQFAIQMPDIVLLTSAVCGPGIARNLGVVRAMSDWILFLDADDLIEPDHLENLLGVASANIGSDVVAGGWKEFVDGTPDQFTIKRPAHEQDMHNICTGAIASSPWAVHAALVRRELALQHPWPEHLDGMLAEDNAFWFSICLHGTLALSPSSGAIYRTHTANCRTQSNDLRRWYTGVNAAVEENISALKLLGRTPTTQQAAMLMRLYSTLHSQAIQAGSDEYAALSAIQARHWLKQCDSSSGTLRLRKMMGIQRYEKVRRLFG